MLCIQYENSGALLVEVVALCEQALIVESFQNSLECEFAGNSISNGTSEYS